MFKPTVTLYVRFMEDAGRDRLGNPVKSWSEPVDVPGCLFAPGTPAELSGADRPEGASITATAHFPRGWRGYLKGALVRCGGEKAEWMSVVGEPVPYPDGAVPGPWDTYVLLGATHG